MRTTSAPASALAAAVAAAPLPLSVASSSAPTALRAAVLPPPPLITAQPRVGPPPETIASFYAPARLAALKAILQRKAYLPDGPWLHGPMQNYWTKKFSDRRPTYPFITGDGFRYLCEHRCQNKGCDFAAKDVSAGDCIFIAYTALGEGTTSTRYFHAFNKIRAAIAVPYVIVTHNGDLSAPDGDDWHPSESNAAEWRETFGSWLDSPHLVAWFAQNCHLTSSVATPAKLHCIPIGIENRYATYGARPESYFDEGMVHRNERTASKVLLVDFGGGNDETKQSAENAFRVEAYRAFTAQWVTHPSKRLDHGKWFNAVQTHMFILCPHSHGYDTHRVWEALLVGGFPLVKTSQLDELYDGLPVVIVKKWSDATEVFLRKKHAELIAQAFQYNRLLFPYWEEKVRAAQRAVGAIIA